MAALCGAQCTLAGLSSTPRSLIPFRIAGHGQLRRIPKQQARGGTYRLYRLAIPVVCQAKGFGVTKQKLPFKQRDACPCGSNLAYQGCCKPRHDGSVPAATVEGTLRARFCAYTKREVSYLLSTTHPDYHSFHYKTEPGGATQQLLRDLEEGSTKYKYWGLKVIKEEAGRDMNEGFITFSYSSSKDPADKNMDGSDVVGVTTERSRFVREAEDKPWRFVDYQLVSGMNTGPVTMTTA